MKKGLIVILLMLVGILLLGAINTDKFSESQKKWEYITVFREDFPTLKQYMWLCPPIPICLEESSKINNNHPPISENEMLNLLGKKGWELTSIIGTHSGDKGETIYYFKRSQSIQNLDNTPQKPAG